MFGLVLILIWGGAYFFRLDSQSTITFLSLLWYLILNFYFLYFELAWRGRTPGKRIMRLRVINRQGGELTPTMVIARNLTRQVEIFFPLRFLFTSFGAGDNFWVGLDLLFILATLILPLVTKNHYRLGDLIGGSVVVVTPQAVLLEDLAEKSQNAAFIFNSQHLGIYGDLELKTLEKALRLSKGATSPSLRKIGLTIIQKIKYDQPVNDEDMIPFLKDFYAAERGLLERERLFGRQKDSQNSPTRQVGQEPPTKDLNQAKQTTTGSQWPAKRNKLPLKKK
jgi:uncharacterized RDD family membrane protein YckC